MLRLRLSVSGVGTTLALYGVGMVLGGTDDGPAMTACLLLAAIGDGLQFLMILCSAVRKLPGLPPAADTAR